MKYILLDTQSKVSVVFVAEFKTSVTEDGDACCVQFGHKKGLIFDFLEEEEKKQGKEALEKLQVMSLPSPDPHLHHFHAGNGERITHKHFPVGDTGNLSHDGNGVS